MTNQGSCDRPKAGRVQLVEIEPFFTIKEAAALLNVHAWALRRAIKKGIIPAYTPVNSRKRVRLSEVVAAIDASRIGGQE